MKFLEIKSKGEMEIEAISLIGASTKRGDDSTIGMFGSGLKYGVCAMLRQDIPFVIFSGTKEVKITTKEVNFGGQVFNRVCVNGQETSLTDSMGTEDWNGVFPFIREIYSNALDADKEATIKVVDDIDIKSGETSFYINATPEILQLIKDFDNYFCTSAKSIFDYEQHGEIHSTRGETYVFRKGILAYKDSEPSIFSYNLQRIGINESRVASNRYEVFREVAYLIENCTDERILTRWLDGIKGGDTGVFEHNCTLESYQHKTNNQVFIDFILKNKYYPVLLRGDISEEEKKGRYGLSMVQLKRFLAYCPDIDIIGLTSKNGNHISYIEKEPNEDLFNKVCDAVSKLKSTKYNMRMVSQIKYCVFQASTTLGYAGDNIIWLSTKLDTYSVDEICKIIIEEQEHITSGFGDETRNFQNHLFNLYFNELTR